MKHMGKRIGCAALAAQMLLTPAAQAAEPLRQALDENMRAAVMSHAASCLEQAKQKKLETFPRLRKLAKGEMLVAKATSADNGQNVATPDVLDQYAENENAAASAEDGAEDGATTPDSIPDEPANTDTPEMGETPDDMPTVPDDKDELDGEVTTPVTPPAEDGAEDGATTPDSIPDEPTNTDTPEMGETPDDVPTGPGDKDELDGEATTPVTPPAEDSAEEGTTTPDSVPDVPADVDKPDSTTTTPVTPAEETPAGADVLLPPEAVAAEKPEKEPLNQVRRRSKGGISIFSVNPNDPDYDNADYLDTYTVLAIYGFGPDYRIPKNEELVPGAKDERDYAEEGFYAYNIEDPADLNDPTKGKSWFDFRYEGTENEQWFADPYLDGWILKKFKGAANRNFPYLYAETYGVKDLALNFGEEVEAFEWSSDGMFQYFIGALPGTDEYKDNNNIDMPRLPNKEFTGEWYVLGSRAAGVENESGGKDEGIAVNVDGIPYRTFGEYFMASNEADIPLNYQKLVFNEDRDIVYDQTKELDYYTYDSQGAASTLIDPDRVSADGLHVAMMDPWDTETFFGEPTKYPILPLIARWKDSSNATLTALGLTQKLVETSGTKTEDAKLYPIKSKVPLNELNELKNKTYLELQAVDQSFSDDILHYFLRLPAATTEIALKQDAVVSYEPGSQVTLFATYEGVAPVEYTLSNEETRVYDELFDVPTNSFENPARSIWMLDSDNPAVPVVKTDDSGEEHVLERVTLHVLPPSGDEADAKDYVIYVQQLKSPRMEKDPGNTPMGMIERNDPAYDDTWSPEKKQLTKENFEERLSFKKSYNEKLTPADTINNNGGRLWMGTYNAEAWQTVANVDLDPAAIIVYPDTSFDVPGFTVYDSLDQSTVGATTIVDPSGKVTDGGQPLEIQSIKWKLELTTVDKLLPTQMTDVAGASETRSEKIWSGEGDVGNISLVDYKIKPGVYNLSYTYTDIYDGREHTGDSFDRTVVVLPLHGDVDMDGSVTSADGIALQALVGNTLDEYNNFKASFVRDNTSGLYYYRVCDTDGSGTVNDKDVEMLLQGYTPKLVDRNLNDSNYFYIPLPGGEERQSVGAQVNTDATVPSVSLKYLGTGTSAPDDGGRVNYDPSVDSVFWMELRLNNFATLDAVAGNVTSFTATLTYNDDYVEPYLPAGYDTWGDYVLSLNPQWENWEIQKVVESKLVDGVVVDTPMDTNITPVDTASKATSLLEGWTSADALREVRFSVTPTAAAVNVNPLTDTTANGSVLKVPFLLKKFPAGMTDTDYKLVELALGPRDFLVTTVNNGVAKAALWDNNPAYKQPPTNNVNLKDVLAFAGSDDVKLGRDVTPCYYVYVNTDAQPNYADDTVSTSAYGRNLVYGYGQNVVMNTYGVRDGMADVAANRKPFSAAGMGAELVWDDPDNTPGPIQYNVYTYSLTVTPERAGTFDFTITGSDIPYRLVVDKSVLTLTVDDVKKYYGETTATDKVFSYDPAQIRALDVDAHPAGTNTGKGADLGNMIKGFSAPSIRLMTAAENGSETTAVTPPGDYIVLLQGGVSDNYTFKYVRADKPQSDKEHISDKLGTAKLTVLPRPLLVEKVTKDPVGTLAENANNVGIAGTVNQDEFTVIGLDQYTSLSGYDESSKTIDGIPIDPEITIVSGDVLELAYTGDVIKNAGDPLLGGFVVTDDKEERDAEIKSIALTANAQTQNSYYQLKNQTTSDVLDPSKLTIHPIDSAAKASVEKRKMLKMEILQLPSRMNYTYGQSLNLDQLMVEAYFSDRPTQAWQASHTIANLKRELGIDVFWVDADGDIPTENAEPATDGEQLHVNDRDGKYLCLVDDVAKSIYAYVGPIHVVKQTLTLTIQTETRYYGETISRWTVGYNFGQLAEWDRANHPQVSGNIDDLTTWMSGFTAPTIVPREGKLVTTKPVLATTDVGTYYVQISGVSADDYKFEYTKTGVSGAEGVSNEFGYAPLRIERRPILITAVVGSAGSMYHDTQSYFVDPARAVAGGDSAGFRAALPQKATTYYTSNFDAYIWDGRWELTRSAVYMSDTLTALYRGEFLNRDNEQLPFYELGLDEPSRTVAVQVSGLRLTGERSKNYLLIFPTADAATNGWAGESEVGSRTTGTVYQRKIEAIKLSGPTKVNYEYGELLSLDGLTAEITYAGENGNPSVVETVAYDDISLGGVNTTTFRRLGLILHMGSLNGAEVENGQRLSVAEHDGRFLYVTGPQYTTGSVVSDRTPMPLRIQKRKLNLTVSDITRKYGEENGSYEYTFVDSDLASWDRELVGNNTLNGTAERLNTASTSAALAAVNAPYEEGNSANQFVAPRFATLAAYNSPVSGSPYTLNLMGGSMANYEFVLHPGQIRVEKRPIRVEKITKDPIYILSQNAFSPLNQKPEFENVICTQEELELAISTGDNVTGTPVVAGDNISLRIVKGFVDGNNSGHASNVNDAAFGANEYEIRRNISIGRIELLSGGDNDNYTLTNPTTSSGDLNPAISAPNQAIVHRRVIESIRIARNPNKMTYTYGEPMDLGGMLLEITYKKGATETETVTVDPTVMRDVFINYWDPDRPTLTGAELDANDAILQVHPAANGDHVTIAVDNDGFAHNGMRLMVSARTYAGQPYVDSVLTDRPVVVNPRELTYTLAAEDKDYDHNRDAVGTITLTNVYSGDEIWVKNGTDYTGSVPSNYAFTSGDYHAADGYDGLKFTFVDGNVSYRFSDDHDMFIDLLDIPVEVTEIVLDGWDKANYRINREVLTTTVQMPGRDSVPNAKIQPIEREAPAVETSLWVDEHTNTVKVLTVQSVDNFGDNMDSRNTLHYEYALIYKNELGGIVITDYQDDPYFGGEPVSIESVDYVPGQNSNVSPEGTGGGQMLDPEDTLFGSENRAALPRGTWIGALVRIAKTNNYQASSGQSSFDEQLQVRADDNNDAELLTALETAARAAEAAPMPKPEDENERQAERVKGPVTKTYTYRLDLVSSRKEKNSEEKDVYVPTLEAVWFTDIDTYESDRTLNRLVENMRPVRYYNYYWDKEGKEEIRFPLALGEDIIVELPVENDSDSSNNKVETLMNPNGTVRFYVNLYAASSGLVGNPRSVKIIPGELTLAGPGETAQLKVRITPANTAAYGASWFSSDESVVTVSSSGKVTAIGPGTAQITAVARAGDISDTITVVVLGKPLPEVKIPYADTMFNTAYTGAFFDLGADGRFEPDRFMTRRELAVVMERFFQVLQDRSPAVANQYSDLGQDPSNSAIETLDKWGIVEGIGYGLFAPDQIVTRAEISIMLCRMLMLPVGNDPTVPHAFTDAQPESHWAWAYIDALAEAKIAKGTGGGYYNPRRPLTRAEVAAFLSRALVTIVDNTAEEVVIPTDVTEAHWAYASILRAVNSAPTVRLMDIYLPSMEEESKK